jgi:hypothetical protein
VLVLPLVIAAEAAIFGVVGGAIGAVVKREVWESYTPTDTRLGIDTHGGVVRVGLQHSF